MEENKKGKELTFIQTLAYSAGVLPAECFPLVLTSWLMVFYIGKDVNNPKYMTLFAFVLVQFVGRLMDSVSDPLVGFFSDRTNSRWGRRIPYIIFGTPFVAITIALVWFPLTDHPSMANNLWLAGNLLVFWLAYTVVVAPHLSLMPEIAPGDKERLGVGGWMAVFGVIGMVLGSLAAGMVIEAFKDGVSLAGFQIKDGYKVTGIISGFIILIFFWLTWWFIKEKPFSESKSVPINFYRAALETLKNPTYPHYLVMIALVRLMVDVVLGVVPFFVVYFLFQHEGNAGFIQGAIIVGSVVFFPLILWGSGRYGKKKTFAFGLLVFASVMPLIVFVPVLPLYTQASRLLATIAVFGMLAPGAAAMLILQRVIITDIMDFDEKRTGYRREAMYNGIEGLITKFAAGLAPVVIGVNLALFNTPQFPYGIFTSIVFSAIIALIGYVAFKAYPIEK